MSSRNVGDGVAAEEERRLRCGDEYRLACHVNIPIQFRLHSDGSQLSSGVRYNEGKGEGEKSMPSMSTFIVKDIKKRLIGYTKALPLSRFFLGTNVLVDGWIKFHLWLYPADLRT